MARADRSGSAADVGLVIVGHGSHRSPAASAPVHDHVDRVRELGGFAAVKPAFWQGEPGLRDVVRTLGTERVRVVPLLMAPGYFADRIVPRELRLGPDEPLATGATVEYTAPVGTHPRLTEVIAQRASGVAHGDDVGLALVGHGTPRHNGSGASTHDHVERLAARGDFDEVAAFFLDDAPAAGTITDRLGPNEIVVVPLFVADGPHSRVDVPRTIGLSADPAGPTTLDGKRVWYTGAIGTAPALTDVIVDLATAAEPERVTEEPRSGTADAERAEVALGHWLAAADGAARSWGQLRITPTSPSGGPPRYSVRHRQDAGRPAATLRRRTDPAAVRETVRFDDRGRFRPLAGGRSLPTGWIVPDRSVDALATVLDVVYPASVVNWYRERDDRLDVTSFSAAAARHTGRFGDLAEIPAPVRRATVTACCGDCVRRPTWSTTAETDSEAAIPCREPCSFLLHAMTTFDAVDAPSAPEGGADRTVPRGALDTAGNRYRHRFLGAFDAGEQLAGGEAP